MGDDAGAFSEVGIKEPETFLATEGVGAGAEIQGVVIAEMVVTLNDWAVGVVFTPTPELSLLGGVAGDEEAEGGAAIGMISGSYLTLPMGTDGTGDVSGIDADGLTAFP